MAQEKIGTLIRGLRLERGLTQRTLGDAVGVGDKAISKWERGQGCPDVSLLAALSRVLGVNIEQILSGDLPPNSMDGGNMKRLRFYRCPVCGSILTSSGGAQVSCCGRPLQPLEAHTADHEHSIDAAELEDDLYLTFSHPMRKDHFLCFVACAALDRVLLVRLSPEQGGEVRFPRLRGRFKLYWCCSEHGLFVKDVT